MGEYRIFLDGNEMFDLPNGLSSFEKTLIRDSGIGSEDQIFRDKCEVSFTFYGDAYSYLCKKRKEDYCEEVLVTIKYRNTPNDSFDMFFEGIFYNRIASIMPAKYFLKSKIYDNSFSALIRERQNNKIFLNASKSINGFDIAPCAYNDILVFDSSGAYLPTGRRAYQFFECFKHLVRFLSDGRIDVISDYFTIGYGANKFAISTGAMLRLGLGSASPSNTFQNNQLIPEITWKILYEEVRKKTRIYMSIEKDTNGKPYIRIEPENYFYNNEVVYELSEIPLNLMETLDNDSFYSEIKVGSSYTDCDAAIFYTHPKIRIDAWENEVYNNCGNCALENALDLVSEWVIDSNVIFETIDGFDGNDKLIFIIELDTTLPFGTQAKVFGDFPLLGSPKYYNDSLKNRQVLKNWEGGIPQCITDYYDLEPCMEGNIVNSDPVVLQHEDPGGSGAIGVSVQILPFTQEVCNSTLSHNAQYANINVNTADFGPFFVPITGIGSLFVCPFFGDYQFETHVEGQNILNIGGGSAVGPLEEYKFELKLLVFIGGLSQIEGGGNIVPDFEYPVDFNITTDFEDPLFFNLTIASPLLVGLPAGTCVLPIFRIRSHKIAASWSLRDAVRIDQGYFKLLEAKYSGFEGEIIGEEIIRPVIYEFEEKICHEDYKKIETNKYGVFKITDKTGWIKELIYKEAGLSKIKLISEDTLCNCD